MKKYDNKHFTLSKRILIEKGLDNKDSIRKIARNIEKSHNAVALEVKKRRMFVKGNHFNGSAYCSLTYKSPFVCNGCENKKSCKKDKYIYSAKDAEANYKSTLVNSRCGIDMDCQEFKELDNLINKEVKNQGHSFDLFLMNHKDIELTPKTLYNYLNNGYLSITPFDIPKIVKYKKRKRLVSKKIKKDPKFLDGRRYKDFVEQVINKKITYYAQMDTVEGVKGHSCLLTFKLISIGVLLAFKIPARDKTSVNYKILELKNLLGDNLFYLLFPIILTDNGHEFFDVEFIEYNGETVKPTKLFFCDPYRSDQKGSLEVEHEYPRRFIPKGVDFDNYSDKDINTMLNNIINTPRKKLNENTPYQLFVEKFGIEIAQKLGLYYIKPTEIFLNDNIFKDN